MSREIHDLAIETEVLAAALTRFPDEFIVADLAGFLKPYHFYSEQHSIVWQAVLADYGDGITPETVTVATRLRSRGCLTAASTVLRILNESHIGTTSIVHLAQRIVANWRARVMATTCQSICAEAATGAVEDPTGWVDACEAKVRAVAEADVRIDDGSRLEVAVVSALRDVGARVAGEAVATIPWRMRQLQRLTGGMRRGKVYAVGGRPGMGKTSLVLQELTALASRDPGDVQYCAAALFSLEMQEREETDRMPGEHEISERLLSQDTGIGSIAIATGELTADELKRLSDARDKLRRLPIYISSRPSISVTGIRSQVRRWMRDLEDRSKGRVRMGLVAIDYLQLMGREDLDSRRARDDNLAFDDMLKGLVTMGKELGVAVLLVSQLKRPEAERKHGDYKLSDFRGSGAIEQHAYGALIVHSSHADPDAARLHIVKMRGGRTGECLLVFDGNATCFWEPERVRGDL